MNMSKTIVQRPMQSYNIGMGAQTSKGGEGLAYLFINLTRAQYSLVLNILFAQYLKGRVTSFSLIIQFQAQYYYFAFNMCIQIISALHFGHMVALESKTLFFQMRITKMFIPGAPLGIFRSSFFCWKDEMSGHLSTIRYF